MWTEPNRKMRPRIPTLWISNHRLGSAGSEWTKKDRTTFTGNK